MAKILMVCSEAAPFATSGGMADVLRALPRALVKAGQEVAVVLPFYRNAPVRDPRIAYERLQFSIGARGYSANILEQVEAGVRYFFVQLPELYDRDALYGEQHQDYPDNYLRFAALCHAALGIAWHVFTPTIIHCHDWQAGLVPLLLKTVYSFHPAYFGVNTVFTIHNLAYRGLFPESVLGELGLPGTLYHPEQIEFRGHISYLKAGLVFSDFLTTVSPRYAKEIQTPHFGHGLDGLLLRRRCDLFGILNGVDYDLWDQSSDPDTACHFNREQVSQKAVCKRNLLAELELPEERLHKPLIGIVSRFAEQKGLDLLAQIPHELTATDVSIAVLGSGEPTQEDFFRWFASAYPDQVAVRIGYEEGLANRIIAGSDMFLMPSRYEPCGLNQIYSLRYGTLPLIRATGGLDDTVDPDTGFKFWGETPAELLECVRAALRVYGTPRWAEMMDSAMQRDFSWDSSAGKYIELYRRASLS